MCSRGTFVLRTASNPCLVRLVGEPGTVQNWLFSCWHCCVHRRQSLKCHVFISISELLNSYLPIGLPGHSQTLPRSGPGLGYTTGFNVWGRNPSPLDQTLFDMCTPVRGDGSRKDVAHPSYTSTDWQAYGHTPSLISCMMIVQSPHSSTTLRKVTWKQ